MDVMEPDASGRSAEAEAWAKKRKAAMQKAAQAKMERQQRPPQHWAPLIRSVSAWAARFLVDFEGVILALCAASGRGASAKPKGAQEVPTRQPHRTHAEKKTPCSEPDNQLPLQSDHSHDVGLAGCPGQWGGYADRDGWLHDP